MRGKLVPDGERAVSEIYGTVLIISVVFLMALVLIGAGMLAFGDITDDADNEMVQQSILEFDKRVSELTEQSVEGSTAITFPDGTASDIDSQPEHGTVNITIETHEAYWNATDSPGALLGNTTSQTATHNITLGSLVYENDDGKTTAYQGGAVWEKQGESVSLVSPPDLSADDQTLELSFVDISSIDLVQQGNEITLEKTPGASSASNTIQKLVEQQMRSQYPDGRYVANATVTLNITSEFAEGWAAYAESNLDASAEVHESSDVDGDRPVAEIKLGSYGDQNTVDQSREYDTNVTYTGLGEFAQDLYYNGSNASHPWNANITDQNADAFTVGDPGWNTSDYTVGILYNNETRGNGPEWWAWNGSDGRWWNVEDPHAAPLGTDMIPDSVVDGSESDPSNGTFGIAADTWSCVVATEDAHDPDDFRNFVPNATEFSPNSSNGCLASPVGVNTTENSKDYVGEFKTDFVIDGFQTKIYNDTGALVHDDSAGSPTLNPKNDALEPGYEVEMTLDWTNEGYRNATANESPIAFVYDRRNKSESSITLPSDPWIVWGDRVGTDMGQSDSTTFSFNVTNADEVYEFWVGAGTKHDGVEPSATWEVQVDTPSTFEVGNIDVNDTGAVEGDEVGLSVDINNTGGTEDTQTIFFWGSNSSSEEEYLINSTEVTLGPDSPDNTTTETFTWSTNNRRESLWQNVTVKAPLSDNKAKANISVDPATSDPANFTIESVAFNGTTVSDGLLAGAIEEGEDAIVTLTVNNTGGKEGIRQITLDRDKIDSGDSARTNSTTLELAPSASPKQVALEWKTIPGDAAANPYTLTASTDDDDFEFDLKVDQRTEGSDFDVNITAVDDPVLAGDTMFVNGTVTNAGEKDNQTIYLKTLGVPDQQTVELATGETEVFNMSWETGDGDVGTHNVTVLSDDGRDTVENVSVEPRDLGEAEFDVSIESATDTVTEGEPVAVEVNVTNTGTARGATVVALEDFEGEFIDVTNESSLAPGSSEQLNLTWYTLVGLVGGDSPVTDEITVEAGGQNATDTANVTVEPRNGTRLPADVVFAIDETGSMGDPSYFPDQIDYNPPQTGTLTVPEDEMWLVTADEAGCSGFFCDSFNDGYFVTNQTVNFSAYDYDDWTDWEIEKYDYPSSGSDDDIERVPAVWTALNAMNSTLDSAAAMQYDTSQNFLTGLGDIEEVNESLRVDPGGSTDIAGAISAAQNKLVDDTELGYGSPDPDEYQTVILLTDGRDNAGQNPVAVANQTNMSHGSNPLDFSVYTVGFGNADKDTLKSVAKYAGNGDGNYTKAENPEELAGIFEGLIKEITDEKEPELAINTVDINGSEDVAEGETVTVNATVENVGEGIGDVPVTLLDWDGTPVNSTLVNTSSEELPSGDSKNVTLYWDTTSVLDGDINTDNLTLVASGNEKEATVTVEDKSAFFDISVDSVDDGVEEGETVTVNATVENTDSAPDTQTLWVEYEDENGNNQTLATSDPVELDGGESTSTSIDWQTGIGDADIEDVTVHSENDMVETSVDIKPKEIATAEFNVTIESTNSPVTKWERLNVTAEIENVNGTSETYPGQVVLTVDGVDKDSKIVALADGESTTETFTWWTDKTGDSINVKVRAETPGSGNSSSEQVTVDDVDTAEETFKIPDVTTNADDGDDSITEDETLNVNISVTNDGDGAGNQTLIVRRNDSSLSEPTDVTAVDTGTILAGNTSTRSVDLSPSEFSAETEEIIVESEDEFSDTQAVDINPTDSTQVDIDIKEDNISATERSQAVEAGEPIAVPVKIKNNGSTKINDTLFVSLDANLSAQGVDQSPANFTTINVTLASGGTENTTILWDTTGAGWDDDPWTLKVESEGEFDREEVYVDELPGTLPGGPDFGSIGSGIDFTIEDIEVAE